MPLKSEPTEPEDYPSVSPQPSRDELEQLGIKVKDFAYESTLPPIPSYVPRREPPARQVQPQPSIEKRPYEEHEVSSLPPSHLGRERYGNAAKRRRVEPMSVHEGSEREIPVGSHFQQSFQGFSQESQISTPSRSQPPLVYGGESQSQESDWVVTPFVTPNGSMQWPVQDTSSIPISQLETALQQFNEEVPVSHSQLGFSKPSDIFTENPSSLAHHATAPATESSPHVSPPAPRIMGPPEVSRPARYNLRTRPQPPLPPETHPKRSRSRRREKPSNTTSRCVQSRSSASPKPTSRKGRK